MCLCVRARALGLGRGNRREVGLLASRYRLWVRGGHWLRGVGAVGGSVRWNSPPLRAVSDVPAVGGEGCAVAAAGRRAGKGVASSWLRVLC